MEQKRLNALVFVKYNLALEQRQTHRQQGTDPICLDEMDDSDEWIVEMEAPVLPEETSWLDIVDCFVEQEPEPSRKRSKWPLEIKFVFFFLIKKLKFLI